MIRIRPWVLVGLPLAVVGAGFILLCTSRYGVGLSPDSINYISVVQSLAEGKGFLVWYNDPLVVHAPLFSCLLALLSYLGLEPFSAARFLNAFTLGFIILASGMLFRSVLRSKYLIFLGMFLVLLSTPLFDVAVMAWSEPFFILLTLLFVVAAQKVLRGGGRGDVVTCACIAVVACFQRYIGITLIGAGLVLILAQRTPLRRKVSDGIVFSGISLIPFVAWAGRNYILTKTLFGPRFPASEGFSAHLRYTLDVVTLWFIPSAVSLRGRAIVLLLIIAGMLTTSYFLLGKKGALREGIYRVFPSVCFVSMYTGFLIFSASTVAFDRICNRLLSPIYVFIVLFLLIWVEDLLRVFSSMRKVRMVVVIGVAVASLFVSGHLGAQAISRFRMCRYVGAGGFNTIFWRESPLVRWLQAHPLEGKVYTNAPDAVYLFLSRRVNVSPRKHAYRSAQGGSNDLANISNGAATGAVQYVVWFKQIQREYLYTIDELKSSLMLEETVSFPDGGVYLIKNERGLRA